ncbi:extensin-like [Salvia divinorum]|uniref:Extensin-like n=1 Tax=Salvia divinorum TaxID=28513 RepID=A0ABD1GQE8_SALDI
MVPEMEKPQVTEIKVRMDCNGCVQKIKKALQGVAGIQGINVDFLAQKLTITGWAEPEKLVKAIQKTRKSAVICVHTEETGPLEGEEEASPGEGPPPPETPPEPTNQRGEPPRTEAAPPGEAQDEQPPLQPENPPPATRQPYHQQTRPNGAEGVRVVYHHPLDHGYGRPWNGYHVGPGFGDESHQPPPAVYVQSYNTYRPSPHVTEYAYPQPPPPRYSYDTRPNPYSDLGFKEEPPQPQPQPPQAQLQPQPQLSPPPRYTYNARPDHYSGPGFRDEPPQPQPQQPQPQPQQPQPQPQSQQQQLLQPPQPVYATHSYNTFKPSPYVTGYAYPRSPPRPSTHIRPDSSWGPGLQGESEQSQPSQSPQPVYATHSQNIYRPSSYVTEYAYPESPPPRYSSYSIPENYSRDYYGGSHGNGNVTSMFSEENPNACRIV